NWTGKVPFEVHEMRAKSDGFELTFTHEIDPKTAGNVARTMIEAYPLAGVLGTILAIGSALQSPESAADVVGTMSGIVSRFGDAIWSTFCGLFAAIILMFVNSMLETRFERLTQSRIHVRDMVARAKRELAMVASRPVASDSALVESA
ncbi:MAG: MotA/TolQ/ExbB proton channel family protein, partial [Planctomycetaceae bacterium]